MQNLSKSILAIATLLSGIFINNPLIRYLKEKKPIQITPTPISREASFSQDKLWELINNWRKEQGYEPYKEHFRLCELTFERLNETKNNWVTTDFSKRKINFYYNQMAENLAKDYENEEMTLNSWLNSPTISKQLKDNSQYSCLRCDSNRCVQLIADISDNNMSKSDNSHITNNSDPYVNCLIHINCGGGSKLLRQSECNQKTCCNYPANCGGPKFVYKTECDNLICCSLQGGSFQLMTLFECNSHYPTSTNTASGNNSGTISNLQSCTIYYPSLGYSRTYQLSISDCLYWTRQANTTTVPFNFAPPPTMVPYPTLAPLPTYSYILPPVGYNPPPTKIKCSDLQGYMPNAYADCEP